MNTLYPVVVCLKKKYLKNFKKAKYDDIEALVYGFQLTYDEIIDKLVFNYIPTKEQVIL